MKNGSVVVVDILHNGEKVLSYEFEIEKEVLVDVPNTRKNIAIITFIISTLIIIAGFVFLKKSTIDTNE